MERILDLFSAFEKDTFSNGLFRRPKSAEPEIPV